MHRPRATLVAVCLGLATVVSAVSALNVAIPSVASDTGASQTELTWIIDAYALTFAALLLPFGSLGDRVGRRRTLLAGLALFGLTALAAMGTTSPDVLLGLRALLGAAAALVMPATLSTITGTFPASERVKGVAVWTGVAGASAVLGLVASGLLLEQWSWRSVFGLNVAMAAIALVSTVVAVPESRSEQTPGTDLVGTALSTTGLAAVVWSLIEAPTRGWTSAATLVGLGCGLAVLALFLVWEARTRRPLLDPRLFRRPAFAAGALSILVQFFAFFGFVFVFLQYLQLVRGYSPLTAAFGMLPLAAGLMPAARIAPAVVLRAGRTVVCGTGLALITLGLGLLSTITASTSYGVVGSALWGVGLGMGLAMTPATSAITDALPRAQQGLASAVNDLARELGGALGIATVGSVLNATYRSTLDGAALPAPLLHRAQESLAVGVHLGPAVAEAARSAFVDGLQHALVVAAGTVGACGLVVVVLLARGRRHPAEEGAAEQGESEPTPAPGRTSPRDTAALR